MKYRPPFWAYKTKKKRYLAYTQEFVHKECGRVTLESLRVTHTKGDRFCVHCEGYFPAKDFDCVTPYGF